MSWNREYWDVVWDYFWSPNWLGCMRIRELCQDCRNRPPSREKFSEAAVIKGLQRREESLNHIFNIFLRLLPDETTSRLFSVPFGRAINDRFQLVGAEVQSRFKFRNNVTQQDVFLVGTKNIVCVELKLGSKSELMQVAKYALLCALEECMTGERDSLRLVYLAPEKPFDQLWKERFRSEREFRSELSLFNPVTAAKKSLSSIFSEHADTVRRTLDRMEIGFMTYAQIADAIEAEKVSLNEKRPGDQTLCRLIDGMLAELRDRGLVHA